MSKEWNPSPDEKLVKGIYNGLYARQRADKPEGQAERKNSKRSRAHRLDIALKDRLADAPEPTRARTHDSAAQLPSPVTPVMRVDAIRGMVGLYNRGMVSPENLLNIIVDIATDPKPT